MIFGARKVCDYVVCVLGRVCGWCFDVVLGDYSDDVVVVYDHVCCCCVHAFHGDVLMCRNYMVVLCMQVGRVSGGVWMLFVLLIMLLLLLLWLLLVVVVLLLFMVMFWR